jgi:hypothetical protein
MFLDKNSIIIDGVNMGQYLVQAQYSFNKLWSSDSGRSLRQENNQAHSLEYFQN